MRTSDAGISPSEGLSLSLRPSKGDRTTVPARRSPPTARDEVVAGDKAKPIEKLAVNQGYGVQSHCAPHPLLLLF